MVRIVLPEEIGLLDIVLISVVILATVAVAVLVILAKKPEPEKEKERPRKKREIFERLAEELGLDRVLVKELSSIVDEELRSGRVRLALYSSDCPGRIVVDIPARQLMCIDTSGRAWPLEGEAVGEEVEVEERENA